MVLEKEKEDSIEDNYYTLQLSVDSYLFSVCVERERGKEKELFKTRSHTIPFQRVAFFTGVWLPMLCCAYSVHSTLQQSAITMQAHIHTFQLVFELWLRQFSSCRADDLIGEKYWCILSNYHLLFVFHFVYAIIVGAQIICLYSNKILII